MLRNLAYTKTVLVLAALHLIMRFGFESSAERGPLLPEYGSLWAAINYGPLGDAVGKAVAFTLAFLLLGVPISLVMDWVALVRRKRSERESPPVDERPWR